MDDRRFPGVYRGTVFSNKDPLGQGRLKLQVPQVLGSQPTDWVWPVKLNGVNLDIPAVGQGVWVAFEGGDSSFPVWLGTFGTPQTPGMELQLRHLQADEIIERIAFLISTEPINGVKNQVDVVETILNISKKLTERNYASLYDTTTQPAAAVDTPQVISINTVDFASNVSVVGGSKITIANVGAYNLQWSGQFVNTDSSAHDVRVWVRYNGVDYPQSASIVTIPSKHGSVNGHTIAAWNWLGKSQNPNDYVEIVWSSESTLISLTAYPAGIAGPAVPSVIVTLTEAE